MQQRSEEWFRARCGRITGSRFADAMSRRNSKAYSSLVNELVRERRNKQVSRGYVSPAMQWGVDHESAARHWYATAHGRSVHEIGFVVHPQYDFVGVSPDGLVDPDGLVEIKCPQMTNFRRIMESREMPARYRWQVQGQMWVCGRDWLDFVCFYPPGRGMAIRVNGSRRDFDCLAERCLEIDGEVQKRLGMRQAQVAPKPVSVATQPPIPPLWLATRSDVSDSRRQASESKLGSWWIWAALVLGGLVVFNQ